MSTIVLIKAGRKSVRQHYSPPLGIMSIAAYGRERAPGTDFRLIDMLTEDLTPEAAAERALGLAPDLVGISAMSYQAEAMKALARECKARRPELPVIAGGPHPSTHPADALSDGVDLVVRGEGEQTFLELLPRLLAGERRPADIPGIAFRRDGELVLTPPREEFAPPDSLPTPAYDLIDLRRYWDLPRFGTTSVHREYAILSTSRACPYQCTYCHRLFGSRYRAQSPEIVLRDLETLARDYRVREIQFVDDCFNLDKSRVAAICDGIVERGLKFAISFPNGLRGDIMDEPTLDKLKAAGTYRITYAIESASPRIQKFLKKNVKLDRLKEVIAATDARGIMVDGFFMVGFPGEKREEIEMTFKYAIESRLHTANFWFVTPFKGTELHRQAEELGLTVPENPDALHYFDPTTDLSEVGAKELKKMVQKNFLRFYLNPWRLWRIFRLFPNKRQIPALFLRFLKISLKWN
jgi:radical SAM superfamily enzyme YgiQ (UPF0313 family)